MEFTHHLLMAAWHQVCRKLPMAGVDGINVDWFADRLEMELPQMQHHLDSEIYLALPAKGFYLRKSTGGKRLLGIPNVRDRNGNFSKNCYVPKVLTQKYDLNKFFDDHWGGMGESCR